MTKHLPSFVVTAAVALLLAALAALPTAHAAAPPGAGDVTATAAAKCIAKIQVKGKWRVLRTTTYKYRYKRVKGSKRFRRTVKKVRVAVRVSCARACVLMKGRGKKRHPVFSYKRVRVKVKRGHRIVKVKRRRKVYRYGTCPKSAASLGQPISVNLLPGSAATLDFGSFQRESPITGKLRGFVAGGVKLTQDNQMTFTKADLHLGQTPVFIDDDCGGQVTPSIRTGNPATILLDPSRTSTATLQASGGLLSTTYTKIRLPLELRNDDSGCNQPYITTGYTEFAKTFFFKGKLDPSGGLAKVVLRSAPDLLDVSACLQPGPPTQPCGGFAIPLPITVSTKLVVEIDLSGK